MKAETCFLQSRTPFPKVLSPRGLPRPLPCWEGGCAAENGCGLACSLAFRWMPDACSRVGDILPSMPSWGSQVVG